MVASSRPVLPSWMSTAATKVDANFREQQTQKQNQSVPIPDANLSFAERALSTAAAAVVSAVLVNPLDVAKVGFFPSLSGFLYSFGWCPFVHFVYVWIKVLILIML